jgi:hypothetical protein
MASSGWVRSLDDRDKSWPRWDGRTRRDSSSSYPRGTRAGKNGRTWVAPTILLNSAELLTEEGAIVRSILQLPKLTWPMHAVLERRSPRRHRGPDGSTHRQRARPDCDSCRASCENGAGGSPSQGDSRRDAAVELPEPAWARLLGWLPMRPRHQSTEARHSVGFRLLSDWGRVRGGGLVPWCFRKLAAGERESNSGAVVGGSAVGIAAHEGQDAQPSPASVQDDHVHHI